MRARRGGGDLIKGGEAMPAEVRELVGVVEGRSAGVIAVSFMDMALPGGGLCGGRLWGGGLHGGGLPGGGLSGGGLWGGGLLEGGPCGGGLWGCALPGGGDGCNEGPCMTLARVSTTRRAAGP